MKRREGYILVSVILVLAVVASVTLLVSLESGQGNAAVARDLETQQALFVAEAAYSDAKWQLAQTTTCTGYSGLPTTAFGANNYSAVVAPTSGSPVTVSATGTLAGGATRSIQRTIPISQAPEDLIMQLDSVGIDTYLWDGAHSGRNFGATDHLSISNVGAERTALIQFDLASVPAGAIVQAATLELWLEPGVGSASNGMINAHHVSRAWVEGEYDDQSPPAGSGATYQSYNGQDNWTTFGGDYDSPVVASASLPSAASGWYAWEITDSVSAWHANTAVNHGLLLRAASGSVDRVEFASSDTPTAGERPKLTVTYACECGTACAAPTGSGDLLFVVAEGPDNLSPEEIARRSLFESWGYTVTPIDDSSDAADFDAALVGADVAYVSATSSEGELGDKLNETTIGVVNEQPETALELGFGGSLNRKNRDVLDVIDNTHYITSEFATGTLTLSSSVQPVYLVFSVPPGAQILGEMNNSGANWDTALATLDVGAERFDGSAAPGRRVKLPWDTVSVGTLTDDGETLMRRAIEWALEPSALVAGLIAHWKLDDGGGLLALDSVGSHDGVVASGGPVWIDPGKIDGALDFDGDDDFVLIPSDPAWDLDPSFERSWSLWINPDQLSSAWTNIWSQTNASTRGLSIVAHSTGDSNMGPVTNGISVGWDESGSDKVGLHSANNVLSVGSWHHIVVTHDGDLPQPDRFTIWVDKVDVTERGDVNSIGTLSGVTTSSTSIGGNPVDVPTWFKGSIDDVRVYDEVLSAADIASLFDAVPSGGGGGDGGGCAATVADDFETGDYTGNTGSVSWTGTWEEVNESDGAISGDISVVNVAQLKSEVLRVRDNDGGGEGAQRSVNASDYTSATLSFDYQRAGTDNVDDYVAIEISGDGGKSWAELDRFAGPGNDDGLVSTTYDVSSFVGSTMGVRFVSGSLLGANDNVFFDNVDICFGK